ncbi:helix-turn-helix domain-containing protein [Thermodesulfobacteriota bacterium]
MKVRCGLMTATEAARQLGVSRKTYYKWEQRGLEALLDGLEDRDTGRPEAAHEKVLQEQFEREREELQHRNEQLQQKLELKDLVLQAERQERSKKK